MPRLGLTFHRTFSLSRYSISQIIQLSRINENQQKKKISRIEIEKLNLGSIYIEAMPRYGIGSGLLDINNYPTLFGKYVLSNDPLLDGYKTQILMHYHLSAPHGPGPEFWHEIVKKYFYPGNIFSHQELCEHIGNSIWIKEGKILSERAVKSTATVFLGTYTKTEGLGKLGILTQTNSGRYQVNKPILPSSCVIAVALLDYWAAQFPGHISITLDKLLDSDFNDLFMMSKNELDESLRELQERGILKIYRSSPPFQVVQISHDPEPLFKEIYGTG